MCRCSEHKTSVWGKRAFLGESIALRIVYFLMFVGAVLSFVPEGR